MLPLSWTLYSDAPSAVARMHSPAGSSGQGSRAVVDAPAQRPPQRRAEVAEPLGLAVVDVLRDAAGEHHAVDVRRASPSGSVR